MAWQGWCDSAPRGVIFQDGPLTCLANWYSAGAASQGYFCWKDSWLPLHVASLGFLTARWSTVVRFVPFWLASPRVQQQKLRTFWRLSLRSSMHCFCQDSGQLSFKGRYDTGSVIIGRQQAIAFQFSSLSLVVVPALTSHSYPSTFILHNFRVLTSFCQNLQGLKSFSPNFVLRQLPNALLCLVLHNHWYPPWSSLEFQAYQLAWAWIHIGIGNDVPRSGENCKRKRRIIVLESWFYYKT